MASVVVCAHLSQINLQRENSVEEKTEAFSYLHLYASIKSLYYHILIFMVMKKIILFLLAIALFAACDKNEAPNVDKGKPDPNATITIRPADGVKLRSTITGLTALEVVEQAVSIKYQSHYFDNKYEENMKDIARMFDETLKDYNEPALKMYAIDVISVEGDYYRDLTYAVNVVITDIDGDTIAYVPDKVISDARPLIEAAYAEQDYNEVYRIFDEAFTFYPISE